MRTRRGTVVVAVAVVATAALVWVSAIALAAGRGAAGTASVRTLQLELGDRIHVKGTRLRCVVQANGGKTNLVCIEGSLTAPVPHSFAVGIADDGADLAAVSASGASAKLLADVQQPTVSGAAFPPPGRAPRAFTLAPTTAVLIGGTHVFCAVQRTQGVVNVTCGVSSLAAHLQFPTGTYIVSESPRFALIAKAEPHQNFKTVAVRSQP
jgi:hypothetical protein